MVSCGLVCFWPLGIVFIDNAKFLGQIRVVFVLGLLQIALCSLRPQLEG